MKKIEKIIDYFEGNLNEIESNQLLEEIKTNPDLRNEFEDYKKLYNLLSQANITKPNQYYLDSIITKFRSKTKKTFFNFKPVFATGIFILFAAISILLYNILIKSSKNGLDEFDILYEIGALEIENFEDLAYLVNKEEIDELFFAEIVEKENHDSFVINYLHFDDNYNLIPETDAEEIYKELITKKIL